MPLIEDIIATIKEVNEKNGYVPVWLKTCLSDEEHDYYLEKAYRWMTERLRDYRHSHGLGDIR